MRPSKQKRVDEIPKINIGIVNGIIINITITFDFFAPKTKAAPIIPMSENDNVPRNKLKQIIHKRFNGKFKKIDIRGNKMINGKPTEIQWHNALIKTITLKGKFDKNNCSKYPSDISDIKNFSIAVRKVINEYVHIMAGEKFFNKFDDGPKLSGKIKSKLR